TQSLGSGKRARLLSTVRLPRWTSAIQTKWNPAITTSAARWRYCGAKRTDGFPSSMGQSSLQRSPARSSKLFPVQVISFRRTLPKRSWRRFSIFFRASDDLWPRHAGHVIDEMAFRGNLLAWNADVKRRVPMKAGKRRQENRDAQARSDLSRDRSADR